MRFHYTERGRVNTYMVSLHDPDTGLDQRILVRASSPEGMQEFVDRRPLGTRGETIYLDRAIVTGVRKVKAPHTRTNFAEMASTP